MLKAFLIYAFHWVQMGMISEQIGITSGHKMTNIIMVSWTHKEWQ